MRARSIILAGVAALSLSSLAPVTAQAATITLEYEGPSAFGTPSWYHNVSFNWFGTAKSAAAGLFRLKDAATDESVLAWCIDIYHYLSLPNSHDTSVASTTTAQMDNIDRLFNSAYADVTSSDTAAAFQLALWEIMTDTGSGALALNAGNFKTSGISAPYTLAQTYLDNLATATTGGYDLTTYFAAGRSQNLVSGTLSPVSEVPLPATALLLFSGVAGMGAMRRRKKS